MKKMALCIMAFFLSSCAQRQIKPVNVDDLTTLKNEFIQQIHTSDVDEGPFSFNYKFKTVFFSKEVMSLFGEINVQDRLPHGWQYYEGKTLCTVNNQPKEVTLQDLFPTSEHKEYLRQICENSLKQDATSYFAGTEPLCTTLALSDIHTFVINDNNLFIVFQPYRVGGGADGPFIVKIPFSRLKGHWHEAHPLHSLMRNAIESHNFNSSLP